MRHIILGGGGSPDIQKSNNLLDSKWKKHSIFFEQKFNKNFAKILVKMYPALSLAIFQTQYPYPNILYFYIFDKIFNIFKNLPLKNRITGEN